MVIVLSHCILIDLLAKDTISSSATSHPILPSGNKYRILHLNAAIQKNIIPFLSEHIHYAHAASGFAA